jgi:hypothetical protein
MDKLIVGVFITMIIIFVAGLVYFAIRPDPTVYTFGDPNIDDPTLNPYYTDPDYKYSLGYVCQTDDQCDDALVCDTSIMRCRYKDYTPCNDASNCLTTSFCNAVCLPGTTPTGIYYQQQNQTDLILGSSVPCPDGYQSFFSINGNSVIPNAPQTSINICKYAPGYSCHSNDDCASSGCADQDGNICDKNCGIGGGWCLNKARNGEPCTDGNTCSSGYCYPSSDGKQYCQNPDLAGRSNPTLGMVCSIDDKGDGMPCENGNRCVGGICATPSSSLLQGCSYLRTCPGSMNCYNIPYPTYNSDSSSSIATIIGLQGSYHLCGEDDINCVCTYYMDLSNDSDTKPPDGSGAVGVFGNLIPNTVSSGQSCIMGMALSGDGKTCVSSSGPVATSGQSCKGGKEVDQGGPFLYLLSVYYPYSTNPQDYPDDINQQYYPINGIINATNFEYVKIPYQKSINGDTISKIKGVTLPINTKDPSGGTNEIVYLISDTSLYECLLYFKDSKGRNTKITNPSLSTNYKPPSSDVKYTTISDDNGTDFQITQINLKAPENVTYVVKDILAVYKPNFSSTGTTPTTTIYVLLNVTDSTGDAESYYQICNEITRQDDIGTYGLSTTNKFNVTTPANTTDLGHVYEYMTGYYSWRTPTGGSSDDYNFNYSIGTYIMFSKADNSNAVYFYLSTSGSWSVSNTVTNYSTYGFDSNARPAFSLTYVPQCTGGDKKHSCSWHYYGYLGYGMPNSQSQVKYYGLKNEIQSTDQVENGIPNYLVSKGPDGTGSANLSYQSYYFDINEYFFIEDIGAGVKNYTPYANAVAMASYTTGTGTLGGDINLYYSSGSTLTAIPGSFSDGTKLSLSPNELYILAEYSCTP